MMLIVFYVWTKERVGERAPWDTVCAGSKRQRGGGPIHMVLLLQKCYQSINPCVGAVSLDAFVVCFVSS